MHADAELLFISLIFHADNEIGCSAAAATSKDLIEGCWS